MTSDEATAYTAIPQADTVAPGRRGPGRPRKNAEHAPQHTSAHTAEREVEREPAHSTPRRMRRRKGLQHDDPFYIPLEEIPEGLSYEWKRFSVAGQEDPFYLAQMRAQGWEPVDPKMHPNWVPPDYTAPNIIKGGQILMERPMELTKEARAELDALAGQQMREVRARVGKSEPGELERVKPRIENEWNRMVVEE